MLSRGLKIVLVTVALGYAACLAVLTIEQRELLYFPAYTRVTAADTNFSLVNEGLTLRGWVVHPGQPAALIYFGGNGDAVQSARDDLAHWFPDRSIYLLAYRGYGASEGSPTEAGLFSDARALYDAVHERAERIAILGRSLGSGVATHLASERVADRLILVTPFDSVARVAQSRFPFFPVRWLLLDKYESWRYASAVHCPVLVIAAGRDAVVPADSTRHLLQAFRPEPLSIRLPRADHGDVIHDPAYGDAVRAFLR